MGNGNQAWDRMFPVSGQREREINLDWEREKIQLYASDFIPTK
jgi:hypothetical protein